MPYAGTLNRDQTAKYTQAENPEQRAPTPLHTDNLPNRNTKTADKEVPCNGHESVLVPLVGLERRTLQWKMCIGGLHVTKVQAGVAASQRQALRGKQLRCWPELEIVCQPVSHCARVRCAS